LSCSFFEIYFHIRRQSRKPNDDINKRFQSVANHRTCTPVDSFVQLNSREKKAIDRLNSGDELLTIDDESSELISTEMILMLDQQAFQTNWFYTIETESNHKISLTEYHLIPIEHFQNQRKYLCNEFLKYLFCFTILSGVFKYISRMNRIRF